MLTLMGSRSRRQARSAAGKHSKTPYKKQFLTIDEQIDRLRSRGMDISDDDLEHAHTLLSRIGYYRLSGYWHIYRKPENEVQTPEATFISGIALRHVEQLYDFDRRLRVLVFDAIESIEVALRALIGHTLGAHGSMAHTDPTIFRKSFSRYDPHTRLLDSWETSDHCEWMKSAQSKTGRSKGDFVKHFRSKYGLPLPVWVVTEVIDFSDLSKIYEGMLERDQRAVATGVGAVSQEGEPPTDSLRSWLRVLTFVRNTCAHHSRLWNVNMVAQVALADPLPEDLEHLANLDAKQHARVYQALALLVFLTERINPGRGWKDEILSLLHDAPPVPNYLHRMGFPSDWERTDLWSR